MRRRVGLAVVVLLAALAAPLLLTREAAAGEQWCEDDPLVLITTPGGAQVPLYVTNAGLGLEHLVAVQTAAITYSAVAAGTGTTVLMKVTIPDDQFAAHFQTRSSVSTGPLATGMVYDSASGFSGQRMQLTFSLDVP